MLKCLYRFYINKKSAGNHEMLETISRSAVNVNKPHLSSEFLRTRKYYYTPFSAFSQGGIVAILFVFQEIL